MSFKGGGRADGVINVGTYLVKRQQRGRVVIKSEKWVDVVYGWPLILNFLYSQACRLSLALGLMSGATICLMAKQSQTNGKGAKRRGSVQLCFNTPCF